MRFSADLGWSVTYGDEVLEVDGNAEAVNEAGSGNRANGEWPDDGAIRPGSEGCVGSYAAPPRCAIVLVEIKLLERERSRQSGGEAN